MSSPTAVVVGAGIAGVAAARVLREGGVDVTVLDRGRRRGGRLGGRTVDVPGPARHVPARHVPARHVVDTGAAYVTVSDERFAAVVDGWAARGVALPWTSTFHLAGPDGLRGTKPGPVRWAAPAGLRSLVDDLAAGLEVRSSTDVRSISVVEGRPSVDGRPADAVVLAMPDPQAGRLLDVAAADGLAAARRVLTRPWEPVVSVWAVYGDRWWPDLDAAFVADDPLVTLVADDGRRRGDGAPVLVAHASPAASREHLQHPEALVGPVLEHAAAALGGVSTGGTVPQPTATGVQRWSFASPVEGHEEPCWVGGVAGGLLGLCGDGWGGTPKVERAWASGHDLGRELLGRV